MINTFKTTKQKIQNKRARLDTEMIRQSDKTHSPGVPPNSCPYINVVQTMIEDLQTSYDDLRDKNHHNPMTEEISEQAKQTLEVVRRMNETLRDNSAYWYNKYKDLLKKQGKNRKK